MSDEALTEFQQARLVHRDRSEARTMRTFVNQARGDTHGAGARWPFELTQNAHDPGARESKLDIDIELTFDGQMVVYEHNDKPFSMQELAALLSGGSSKEFDSTETTGRFGTGFLVTHVLSPRISFTGLVNANSGLEEVSVQLDRSGDDDQIFENTKRGYQAIAAAQKIASIDGRKTARFEYPTDNAEATRVGFGAFRITLPYLYGTCEHLGSVRLQDEAGMSWVFVPGHAVDRDFAGYHLRVRPFELTEGSGASRRLQAVRLRRRQDAASSLVVVTEQIDDQWRIWIPAEGFSRIFCRLPVRASEFLPINAVIDGRFDLRQERDRVLMKPADVEQIADALSLLPILVQLAQQERWLDGHKLAHIGMPDRAFGEKLEEQKELQDWWRTTLRAVAQRLTQMPIIETAERPLPASGNPPLVTFVLPRFSLGSISDELPFGSVWDVANEVRDVRLPVRRIASDWSEIANAWRGLGLEVSRVGLSEIADGVRPKSSKLQELKVTATDPISWLARFLDLVAQVSAEHNCTPILKNLLPDQTGMLRSPDLLSRDLGIKKELKDIGRDIGRSVRARLLHEQLVAFCNDASLPRLKGFLDAQVSKTLDETAVIKECIEELRKQLSDNKPVTTAGSMHRQGSIDLLKYLFESKRTDSAELAKQCPLIAFSDIAVHWISQRKMLAPVSVWKAAARPFASLYESDRVLADAYSVGVTGGLTLAEALVSWGLAFADPLYTETPRDLPEELLKVLAVDGEDCTNVKVANVPLSQIAMLPSELIQRCQRDEGLARLLLGLTLQHIVTSDTSWRDTVEIPARRDRAEIRIRVRPALWLANLKGRAWVPVRSEKDGKEVLQPGFADAGTLRPLLDPAWLAGNDAAVEVLSTFFGFKALELRLLSTVGSERDRTTVEDRLAKIVQVLGGNPEKYEELAAGLAVQQEREAQKEKNRRFGLAIQQVIEEYLKKRGLHLKLIDRGYDYDLFLESPALDAGTHHFELADYLLEVKATTTGEVRLTPAQARTASEELGRFILCVVDLRDVEHDRLEVDWTPAEVEPRARIVIRIGALASESHDLVEQAKGCEVGIRNDTALRYGVPVAVWQKGSTLAEWVDSLSLSPTA